ncbi:hypothetical protein T484DRAFT_1826381 [Baffinella frigidus]|nr:hypothetical protein T484DRAFT_1826381 [Cryptophyta sp. CCMP2293]
MVMMQKHRAILAEVASGWTGGAAILAEVASVQLEFGALSRHTKDPKYDAAAIKFATWKFALAKSYQMGSRAGW